MDVPHNRAIWLRALAYLNQAFLVVQWHTMALGLAYMLTFRVSYLALDGGVFECGKPWLQEWLRCFVSWKLLPFTSSDALLVVISFLALRSSEH